MVNDRLRTAWIQLNLIPEPQTIGDLIRGRQTFHISGQPVKYAVERGTVTECGVSVMSDEEINDFYRNVRETDPIVRKILEQ